MTASQPTPVEIPSPAAPASGGTRVIAMMNQKGGVGKTTTAANLAAALALNGKRVLVIDLDPQAHLTLHLGVDPASLERSIYDMLTDDDIAAADIVRQVSDNLHLLPAEVNLAGAEAELAPRMVTGTAQRVLKDKVTALLGAGQPYDFVILDCPPSLGLLTINALVLAREVIVPMQAHFLALQGLSKLFETVRLIRQSFNPELVVSGIVMCMHEANTNLATEVMADITAFLDSQWAQDVPWRNAIVLAPAVRRNIKLAESPSFGQTIFDYEPECAGAQDYRRLAESVVAHPVGR